MNKSTDGKKAGVADFLSQLQELVSVHDSVVEFFGDEIKVAITEGSRSKFVHLCLSYIDWCNRGGPVAKSLIDREFEKSHVDVWSALACFPAMYDLLEIDSSWMMNHQAFGPLLFALREGSYNSDQEVRNTCKNLMRFLGKRLFDGRGSPVLAAIRECPWYGGTVGHFLSNYKFLLEQCQIIASKTPIPRGKSATPGRMQKARTARINAYKKAFPKYKARIENQPLCYAPKDMALRLLSDGTISSSTLQKARAYANKIADIHNWIAFQDVIDEFKKRFGKEGSKK
jgi:hypothetical protein